MLRLKESIVDMLVACRGDHIFRYFNKKHLNILMYHAVNVPGKCPPLFNHITTSTFRLHLIFLKKYYTLISLETLLTCLQEDIPFPDNALMITFDDGYQNNYRAAFPLLKEFNIPATIFLTVDFIGTNKLLWFDDLYLYLEDYIDSGQPLRHIEEIFSFSKLTSNLIVLYSAISSKLKSVSNEKRSQLIADLKSTHASHRCKFLSERFEMLQWEQVKEMSSSGLIDFGVHTATHKIVSALTPEKWEQEIAKPKRILSLPVRSLPILILNFKIILF